MDESKYCLENCDCGWNNYYSKIFGVRFPCLHEIGNINFEHIPEFPPLTVPEYEPVQKMVIIYSDKIKNFDNPKPAKKRIMVSNEEINIHLERSNISPNCNYAKREMWKIIHELTTNFSIKIEMAINIVLDGYLAIINEETADLSSIAMLRIKCYMDAENLKQKQTAKENQSNQ